MREIFFIMLTILLLCPQTAGAAPPAVCPKRGNFLFRADFQSNDTAYPVFASIIARFLPFANVFPPDIHKTAGQKTGFSIIKSHKARAFLPAFQDIFHKS
ncbi:MAG: hypothetical protein Q3Y08_09075 [Butyricicoccus sp.]|nr:hypothetical protein [Butyricicoccus sp.]